MERLRAIGRIGELFDHPHKFDHRAGPAMRHHQRQGIGAGRTQVQKVNVEPIDLGLELPQSVKPRFALSPVIAVAPIANQVLQSRQWRALRPIRHRLLLRPAGQVEPRGEVVQLRLGNGERKGADLGHGPQCEAILPPGQTASPHCSLAKNRTSLREICLGQRWHNQRHFNNDQTRTGIDHHEIQPPRRPARFACHQRLGQ